MKTAILIVLSLLVAPVLAKEMTEERRQEVRKALASCKVEAYRAAGPRPVRPVRSPRTSSGAVSSFFSGMEAGRDTSNYRQDVAEWKQVRAEVLTDCMESRGFTRD